MAALECVTSPRLVSTKFNQFLFSIRLWPGIAPGFRLSDKFSPARVVESPRSRTRRGPVAALIYLLRGMRRFRPAYARLDTGGFPRHGRQCIPIRHTGRGPLPPFCVGFSRRPSCHQRQAPPLHLTTAHEVYGRSNARRYASARWHVPGSDGAPAL